MTLAEARRWGQEVLSLAGIENPSLDVDILLSSSLGCSRSVLFAHPGREVPREVERVFRDRLARRAAREPVALVLGEAFFYGRSFLVGAGVLVPRPETELLVEEALRRFDGDFIVDWGTGSGCIAGTLLAERGDARALAVEASPAALTWAWRNCRRLGVLDRTLLWHAEVPERVPLAPESVSLFVSNPPYIPTASVDGLMPEVRLHEPRLALDGGSDGCAPYRMLLPWAARVLRPGGWALVEIGGAEQVEAIRAAAPAALFFEGSVDDYGGKTRILLWRKRGSGA